MEEGNVKYKYPLPQESESLNTFFIDELIVNETCYRKQVFVYMGKIVDG